MPKTSSFQPQIAINRRAEELARSGDYPNWLCIADDLRATFSPKTLSLEFASVALQDELDRLCRLAMGARRLP